jgi:hypothetical protein
LQFAWFFFAGLSLFMQWESIIYLHVEIPQVKSEIERMTGISVVEIDDNGPSDEIYVRVTLMIEEKGELVIISPRYEDIVSNGSIDIERIDNCFLSSDSPKEIRKVSLETAVNEYTNLYVLAKDQGLCEYRLVNQ